MGFFKKKDGGGSKRTRLFYATDVHGSERTFRKFVNGAKFYKVDHVIMGGDIMGKFMIPIVDEGGGHHRVTLQEELHHLDGEDEVKAIRDTIETLGFYHITVTEDELHDMQSERGKVDETFRRLAHERLERWIALADERLNGTGIKCYVTGGNDDPEDLVAVLENSGSEHVINCEGRIVMIDDTYPMASSGYSNATPWDTPRETNEEQLEAYLEESIKGLEDFENAIFNMHVPPYDCTLDDCPKLDWSTDPPSPIVIAGVQQSAPAGSTAVRHMVDKYKPLLVLTGHIHESRGLVKLGRSTVVNPGSEYAEGILRGCILSLVPGKVDAHQMTAG